MPDPSPARRLEIAHRGASARWEDKQNISTIKPLTVRTKSSNSKLLLVTDAKLTPLQIAAIELILGDGAGQSIPTLAQRLGIHRVTLSKWLRDEKFSGELQARARVIFAQSEARTGETLIEGANDRSDRGWTQAQKLYWQLRGELVERTSVEGSIAINHSFLPIDKLSLTTKRLIAAELDGWVMSEELEEMIEGELPMLQVQVESSKSK